MLKHLHTMQKYIEKICLVGSILGHYQHITIVYFACFFVTFMLFFQFFKFVTFFCEIYTFSVKLTITISRLITLQMLQYDQYASCSVWFFLFLSWIFHSYKDVTITLSMHSTLALSSKDSWACHNYCDMGHLFKDPVTFTLVAGHLAVEL